MNLSSVFTKTILATLCLFLLSGCCRYINCDCAPGPTVGVYYESDSVSCPADFASLISATRYNESTNQIVAEADYHYFHSCSISFSYVADSYWVITSDSLGINDTLRIKEASFFQSKDNCCRCGPQFSNVELDVNGQVSSGNTIVRKF